jgi:small subunit ribosomal protein S19e
MGKNIYTQDTGKYITELAEALKKLPEFKAPEWAGFVKSGISKARPPAQEDFWHIRSASILRQLYIKGVIGVGKLRIRYGSKKDRGGRPDKFKKASGKIIRTILQQAEAAGLVEKLSKLQFGRRLTEAGRNLLDSIEVGEKESLDLEKTVVKMVPAQDVNEVQENVEENETIEEEIVVEENKDGK